MHYFFYISLQCVIDYKGFAAVCLSTDVLDVAYYAYREHAKRTGKVFKKFGNSQNEVMR